MVRAISVASSGSPEHRASVRSCRCLAQTCLGLLGLSALLQCFFKGCPQQETGETKQKSTKVVHQHAYPNEPLFQSPLEGKSSLGSTEAARADDLNVSRKVGEGT